MCEGVDMEKATTGSIDMLISTCLFRPMYRAAVVTKNSTSSFCIELNIFLRTPMADINIIKRSKLNDAHLIEFKNGSTIRVLNVCHDSSTIRNRRYNKILYELDDLEEESFLRHHNHIEFEYRETIFDILSEDLEWKTWNTDLSFLYLEE